MCLLESMFCAHLLAGQGDEFFAEVARATGNPATPAEQRVLRSRVKAAVKRIEQRVQAVPNSIHNRVMKRVSMVAKQDLFLSGTEADETTVLAADRPPSRATLRARAHSSRAWHDDSWVAYTLLLFRSLSFALVGYEGGAGAVRSTSPGGAMSRGYGHLSALHDGKNTKIYNIIREFPGELAFFLGCRLVVSECKERYAFLDGVRVVLIEVSYSSLAVLSRILADVSGRTPRFTLPPRMPRTRSRSRGGPACRTAAQTSASVSLSRGTTSSALSNLLPYLVKDEPSHASTASPLGLPASLASGSGPSPASHKSRIQTAGSAAPSGSSSTPLSPEHADYDSLRPEDQDIFAQWVGYDGNGEVDEAPAHTDISIASNSDEEDDEDDLDGQMYIAKFGNVDENKLLGYDQVREIQFDPC